MKTKIIAFDVYGTILATEDSDNELKARDGFLEFATECRRQGLTLVTSSDNNTAALKCDLSESDVPHWLFRNFFPMEKGKPKNFRSIIEFFKIEPGELFVFGDKMEIDIRPAMKLGARSMLLSEFKDRYDTFSWSSLPFSIFE
jgi:FMN phosphatase YigB (HAD superfamily)